MNNNLFFLCKIINTKHESSSPRPSTSRPATSRNTKADSTSGKSKSAPNSWQNSTPPTSSSTKSTATMPNTSSQLSRESTNPPPLYRVPVPPHNASSKHTMLSTSNHELVVVTNTPTLYISGKSKYPSYPLSEVGSSACAWREGRYSLWYQLRHFG